MKIDRFTEGINIFEDASLIAPSQSVELVNADLHKGVLTPTYDKDYDGIPLLDYFFIDGSIVLSSDDYTDYLKYQETVYYTSTAHQPKKYIDPLEYDLGLEPPESLPTGKFDPNGDEYYGFAPEILPMATTVDAELDHSYGLTSTGDSAALPLGSANYFFTLNRFGSRPSLGVIVVPLPFAFNRVIWTVEGAASDPIGIAEFSLYREYSGTYRWLETFTFNYSNGPVRELIDDIYDVSSNLAYDVGDTSDIIVAYTVNYLSSVGDGLSSESLAPIEVSVPYNSRVQLTELPVPAGGSAVTDKAVWRIGPDTTEFILLETISPASTTLIDKILPITGEVLDVSGNTPPPEDLLYLVEAYTIFFGASGPNLYFSKPAAPDYWPAENYIVLIDDITGIFPVNNGLLVFTRLNTFMLLGTSKASFALIPISTEYGCILHKSCKLVRNVPTWLSAEGLCALIGGYVNLISLSLLGELTLDARMATVRKEVYYLLLNEAEGKTLIYEFNFQKNRLRVQQLDYDVICGGIGFFDGILYGSIDDEGWNLLGATTLLPLAYKSPVYTDQRHSEIKLYNNVYIRASGVINLTVDIDGSQVATVVLENKLVYDIKIPAAYQRGSSIQFGCTGEGTVYEIEYKTKGRDNGR